MGIGKTWHEMDKEKHVGNGLRLETSGDIKGWTFWGHMWESLNKTSREGVGYQSF